MRKKNKNMSVDNVLFLNMICVTTSRCNPRRAVLVFRILQHFDDLEAVFEFCAVCLVVILRSTAQSLKLSSTDDISSNSSQILMMKLVWYTHESAKAIAELLL